MRFLYLLGFCLLLSSCSLLLSDNEKAALEEVLKVYGGSVSYTIGTSTSTDDDDLQGKYFQIELSDSPFLNEYDHELEYYMPVVAFIFHKGLSEPERENYDYYEIIVKTKSGQQEVQIPTASLKRLLKTERTASKGAKAFTDGDLDAICSSFMAKTITDESCDTEFSHALHLADSLGGTFEKSFLFAYVSMVYPEYDSMQTDEFVYQVNYAQRNGRLRVSVPRSGIDSLAGLFITYFDVPAEEETEELPTDL